MIRLEDVHKYFGALHVLKGITLDVDRAEVLVIIGPSGSGKSTLLRCVNLLVQPEEGESKDGASELDQNEHTK